MLTNRDGSARFKPTGHPGAVPLSRDPFPLLEEWNDGCVKPSAPGVYWVLTKRCSDYRGIVRLCHWNGVRWGTEFKPIHDEGDDMFHSYELPQAELGRQFNKRQDYPWRPIIDARVIPV